MSYIANPFLMKYHITKREKEHLDKLCGYTINENIDFEAFNKKIKNAVDKINFTKLSNNIQQIIADVLVLNYEYNVFEKVYNHLNCNSKEYYLAYLYYKRGDIKGINRLIKMLKNETERDKQLNAFLLLLQSLLYNRYDNATSIVNSIYQQTSSLLKSMSIKSLRDISTLHVIIIELIIDLYLQQMKFEESYKLISLLEKIAEAQVNPYISIIALSRNALIKCYQGFFLEALQVIEEAMMIEKLINNEVIKNQLLYIKAEIHNNFEELDQAATLLKLVINSKTTTYQKMLAKVMLLAIEYKTGQIHNCNSISSEEEKWFLEHPNTHIRFFSTKLACSAHTGKIKESADIAAKLRHIVKSNNCSKMQKLEIYNSLITYFGSINEYDEALKILNEVASSLQEYQSFGFKFNILVKGIEIYLSMYFRSQELDEFAQLMFYLDELQSLTSNNTLPHIEILVQYIKARVLWSFNREKEAISELQKAKKLARTFRYDDLIREIEKTIEGIESNATISTQQHYNSLHNIIQQYGRIKINRNYEEKKLPETYIILERDTGVPIFEYNFYKDTGDRSILISGLVAAVLMFASNVIGSNDVHQFNYGNYKIFLETSKDEIHMLISKDKDTDFGSHLKDIVSTLNNRLSDVRRSTSTLVNHTELLKIIKEKFKLN